MFCAAEFGNVNDHQESCFMAVKEVNSYTYLAGILVVTYFKTTFRKKEQKSPYYEELI